VIFTCGRSVLPISGRPRTTTLLRFFGSSSFGSEFSTTISFDTSACPSTPRATSGEVSMSEAWSRNTPLCTSVWLPWRITTTLSADPVDTSVDLSPASSISTAANTNTTSAMHRPSGRRQLAHPEVARDVGNRDLHAFICGVRAAQAARVHRK